MERQHEKYERLIARCKALTPVPTAVAHPCDETSLKGAVEAAELGILQPILVGPRAKIEAVAAQFQLDISTYEISDAPHSHAAADLAVLLAVESSLKNRALPAKSLVFGEVGLAGEIRPVQRGQERIREAVKLGFTTVVVPAANRPRQAVDGARVIAVERVDQALAALREF